MNYENFPIRLSEYNLIPSSPLVEAMIEEYNRRFVLNTFCIPPTDDELKIVMKTIDDFYADEDDFVSLCSFDPRLLTNAEALDPKKVIDIKRLDMQLLNECEGLRLVFVDTDHSIVRYIISKDVTTLTGITAVYLTSCGMGDFAEENAEQIATEIAFDPSKIRAIVLESSSEDLEEIDESAFEFDDNDDYCFENIDDDIDAAQIAKHLKEQRAEKELLKTENESPPAYIEIHDKDGMRKYDFDEFRKSTKGILSKPEQESFIKLAEEVFKKAGWLPHD